MPKTLQLSQTASQEILEYAALVGRDADQMAEEILLAGLSTLRRLKYYDSKPQPVDVSDALDILRRAGTEAPAPGDEIPEGYRRRA